LGEHVEECIGYGQDGYVWRTTNDTVVKVFCRPTAYQRERDAYLRLREHNVREARGFAVPRLLGHDDQLELIRISLVHAPFIIDFAKAWLDARPDYSAEVMEDWNVNGQELFGDRWKDVKRLIRSLETYGIYYLDATPGNIKFDEELE
jgi:hypothetical protein